ncbi:ABC transporter permease subunit [Staphylothermus hellenicus]|uniref:Uncharacterized protein n=1 Tax=Staphylothermus hellenicus (strain DSM 12710 / JCM 10830 / BK20S6-10-b1 / P8) TaxID=591019 RepID=D7DCC9_STAHD|nr:ABC transporter permease subunit [Staphylothermus hellenicus]ADI31826.1 hypothetical protein Shell_0705 [Staphylothermus hellenicus DSM 12710]
MNPLIYDLKRSFMRRTTIIMIIIFLLIGIGITYLIFGNIQQEGINPNSKVTVVATLWSKKGIGTISGYIVDKDGKGIPGASIEFYIGDEKLANNKSLDNGYFEIDTGVNLAFNPSNIGAFGEKYQILLNNSKIHVKTASEEFDVKAMISSSISIKGQNIFPASIVYIHKSVFVHEPPQSLSTYGSTLAIINYDESTGKATIIVAVPFLFSSETKYNVSYSLQPVLLLRKGEVVKNYLSRICNESASLGEFDDPVEIVSLNINNRNTTLILCYNVRDQVNVVSAQFTKSNVITSLYVAALSTPVNLVATFIPISMLYIAYVLMAKPRSIGALEFLLARPVTRFDIFINRYIAGILTATLSAIIIVLALVLSSYVLLGVPFIADIVFLLFLGLTLSMITMYSLYYALATSLRSGFYLGLSIGLYLLFALFWQVIIAIYGVSTGVLLRDIQEYSKMLINSYYYNPMGIMNLIMIIIQNNYGISAIINPDPFYMSLSVTLWICVPAILGYLRFQRINLSG